MRKAFAAVLIAVGVFGLVLTVLLPTAVVAKSKKTPLDLDITQISSGPAKLLDPQTGQVKDVRLQATRIVRTDTNASDGTNTTVFETLCTVIVTGSNPPTCVPKDDPRFLSASSDRVTADRKSAEAVNIPKYNEQINGSSTFNGQPVKHVGMSYKFPIDAKKQTYKFFQPDLNQAFPAVFEGTDKVDGLTVYKYICKTGVQPYKIGVFDGTYDDTREVWVEPRTGTIVNGVEHQIQRIVDLNHPNDPGVLALDTTLSFDKSAVDFQSNYAKDKLDKLKVAQLWGPLATGILGVAALVGAYFLLRRRSPTGGDDGGERRNDDPTPNDDPTYAEPPVWAGSAQQ
jgi:hypothetical protein